MQRLDDLCLLFILYTRHPLSTDMDPPDGQNPILDSGGSQQKGADPKLQVADLKAEVGELRSGGIPLI